MRVGTALRGLSAIGALLLTLTAGCTISIQPWSKPTGPAAPSGPVDLLPPPPNRNGPYPAPLPGGMLNVPAQFAPNNEMIQLLSAKLATTEDQLNTIQAYVGTLKRDKAKQDDQIGQSAKEIEQTLIQIKKLRQDLKDWKTDIDEMSNRIETLEKTRGTMKLLLEQVNAYMERENKNSGKLR